jgi:prepilin-type N-terminal cleavage/methylation domain-containing protein
MFASRRKRRGISLIELLVVTAIIAVLISMLQPAIQRARDAASVAACSNNMRQLAIAVANFSATNKKLPSAQVPGGSLGLSAAL